MVDIKNSLGETCKEVVSGLSKESSSPYLLIFLLVLFCVGFSSLVTYLVFQNSGQSNKFYSEQLFSQIQIANQQVKQFNENIAVTNIALSQLKEQFSDFKIMQSEIQNSIKDHEKRLIKIEMKGNLR
ncbi:MAG: hypothetical protein DCC88_00260 [Spirobacillus cienkowskii]|uniref:Uncharacterized protein n=1 Tax=Spirobacillus cienkowskii TaxID=495820 RepID=A0A369L070_9BACT|nr:MAG: hypothetical protein DCC88_00260 [Spirobacillus cienkowskii]